MCGEVGPSRPLGANCATRMMNTESLPLLQHSLESPSAFTPERLMEAVRAERSLANETVPPLVDEAVLDEGTSLHYVPPSATIVTPTPRLAELMTRELGTVASHIRRGTAWTTDAPYRETPDQLRLWAERGVLAVEMQAASLFAFARARAANVAMVALVSNSVNAA